MSRLATVKRRLKEPSTWAGLGVLGTLFGVKELAAFAAPEVAVALTALMAIFLPEGPPASQPPQQ